MCLAPKLRPQASTAPTESKPTAPTVPSEPDIHDKSYSTACEKPQLTALEPCVRTSYDKLITRMWSAGTLIALITCAPVLVVVTAIIAVINLAIRERKTTLSNGKVAIITGGKMTKSMMLVRQLKAQGCRVVLVETSKYWMVASRFSKCVDRFVTVPVPEKETDAFLEAMGRLAEEESADVFVPVTSPVASQYESLVANVLPAKCHSWSLPAEEVERLDDKVIFCQAAEALGLSVPTSQRICHADQVRAFNERLLREGKQTRYIFKSIKYDSMHRLDLFTLPCAPAKLDAYLGELTLDEENPWVVQTFIQGDEYSTCAFVHNGALLAFSDNRASISCFNYMPARNKLLRQWVQSFCAARKLSGIVCIDFIVEADGTPYAIECNPRASSNIASFYNNPQLGASLLAPEAASGAPAEPLPSAVETYWIFAEMWAAVTKPGLTFASFLSRVEHLGRTVLHKKEAYFDPADPLPFLALHLIHIPTLLLRNLVKGNKWAKIDPCIGKMTEENGD